MVFMTLATVSEGRTSSRRSMLSSEVIVESLRRVAGAIVAAVVVVNSILLTDTLKLSKVSQMKGQRMFGSGGRKRPTA